jgi:hypothetical protein
MFVYMNMDQMLREEYNQNPYLKHLSAEQLSDRLKYLLENITTLTSDGKIGLKDLRVKDGYELFRKFTHTLQEHNRAGKSFIPGFLESASVPKPMLDKASRLLEIGKLIAEKKPKLIKLSQKEYFDNDSYKVSLASSFDDSSLNQAQQDDEMVTSFIPDPEHMAITKMDGQEITGLLSAEINYQVQTDYYIYCSSHTFDYRLFGDFEADACLFIYDEIKFAEDLEAHVRKAVSIEEIGYGAVEYTDPVIEKTQKEPVVHIHKHIRFQYQNEYRYVFVPTPTAIKHGLPKDLYLTMPRVKSYSEVIVF